MVQIPPASNVAVVPETVQTHGVVDAKATGKLELAVALTVSCAVLRFTGERGSKSIICGKRVTAKLCTTAADPYCALPPWLASIVQVPTASKVAVFPEIVQMDGVVAAKLTGKPDEAVALRLTDPANSAVDGIEAKVMV